MSKLPSSAKKAISVIVTIGMIISLFSCMSGLSAFAIGNEAEAKSAVTPIEVKSEVKEEVVEQSAPVNAEPHIHCECGLYDTTSVTYTGHTHRTEAAGNLKEYKAWTNDAKLPTSGWYYLDTDVAPTATVAQSTESLMLCLNGHTITVTNTRAYKIQLTVEKKTFNICDCVGTGKVSCEGSRDFLWASSGNENLQTATINIFGGIYDSTKSTASMGVFYAVRNSASDPIPVPYAAIRVFDGKFYGGSVKNGSIFCLNSMSGGLTVYGGEFDGTGHKVTDAGGAIYANNTAVTINGGHFKNFSAATNGGIICITGTDSTVGLTVNGGTFENGKADKNGGNLFSSVSGKTCTFTAGHFIGGTAQYGGSIYFSLGSHINFGAVDGDNSLLVVEPGVSNTKGATIYASGTKNLNLRSGTIYAGTFTAESGTTHGGAIFSETTGAVKCAGALLTVKEGTTPNATHGGLISASKGIVSLEGTSTTQTQFSVLKGGIAKNMGGNIYVSGSATAKVINGVVEGGVTGRQGGNIAVNAAKLSITGGTVKDGVACSKEAAFNSAYGGGNIYLYGEGATATMSDGEVLDGTAYAVGGNIYVAANTAFTQSGGTVSGGKALKTNDTADSRYFGGNVYLAGTYTMEGENNPVVKDGFSEGNNGGNFSLQVATAKLNVLNGSIINGAAKTYGSIAYGYKAPIDAVTIGGDAKIYSDDTQTGVPEGYDVGGIYVIRSEEGGEYFDKFVKITGAAELDKVVIIGTDNRDAAGIIVTEFTGTITGLKLISSTVTRADKSNLVGIDWDADYIDAGNVSFDGDAYDYKIVDNKVYAITKVDAELYEAIKDLDVDIANAAQFAEFDKIAENIKGILEDDLSDKVAEAAKFIEMMTAKVNVYNSGEEDANNFYVVYAFADEANLDNYEKARIVITINENTVGDNDQSEVETVYEYITVLGNQIKSENEGEYILYKTVELSKATVNDEANANVTYDMYVKYFYNGAWVEGTHTTGKLVSLQPAAE